MEILLIACMLAYAAGTQSEQSKLGLSPAQRAIMREETRHEKAVRKIADRHGVTPPSSSAPGAVPWKDLAAPERGPALTVPEAFRSGYRRHTAVERVATPMGRRAGGWAARGVAWAEDTGKGAVREYRRRRQARGHDDPAPVLVPLPPARPPAVPAMPAEPPTAIGSGKKAVSLKKREPAAATDAPTPAAVEPQRPTEPEAPTGPAAAEPVPTVPAEAPAPAEPQPVTDQQPASAGKGVGRMAAEVTYESVMDESDELSIMCDDDVRVYDRIRTRAEREIGRGDSLIAQMRDTGFGPKVIAWVSRCMENYSVIRGQVDDLKTNTIAQAEAVVKAKALLEAGQGVYADIAKDMESVAERDAYISDAVDAEDTAAHTEIYETKAA